MWKIPLIELRIKHSIDLNWKSIPRIGFYYQLIEIEIISIEVENLKD